MAAKNKNSKKPASEEVLPQEPPATEAASAVPDKQTAEKREKAKGKKESGVMAFIRRADPIAMTCFVVFILAFGVVLGAYIDKMYIADPPAPHIIVEGDEVQVEYVGSYFGYYDKDGSVVFDTNKEDVNNDDAIFKSPSYTNKTKFDPLKFTVGGTSVLEMFGDSVIGHHKGQTVRVAIPAADGYGTQASSDFSLEQTFAISSTLTLSEFNKVFDKSVKAGDFKDSASIEVDSPFEGVSMTLHYSKVGVSGGEEITFTYNVTATCDDARKITTDDNVTYKITGYDDSAKTFTVTFIPDTDSNSMFELFDSDYTVGYVYKEKLSDENYKIREETSDKNAEQLGMTLYFTIKIVKVTA